MDRRRKAIAIVIVAIVLGLLLSLILVAYLMGGTQAVTAMLPRYLVLAIPLALLVGLVLLVLDRL